MWKNKQFLIPPAITLVIVLLVFLIKGIYPFGTNTVMWGDMYQINVPVYYYLYDIFHGQVSMLYDFNAGNGINIYGDLAFFAFSPFSLIILLFKRADIIDAMSVILVAKMMLISLTSWIFFNKYFNKNRFYVVLFSIMTAFSAYVLILYTNIMWLDNVYLFPLLLISLKNLYDKDKKLGYIIVLTLNLIMCFYISFMVLLFIFFSSLVYLHFYVKKEERGRKILFLGTSTLISLMLSAFVLVPSYLQITDSTRIATSSVSSYSIGYLLDQFASDGFILDKLSFLLISSLVYALIILFRKKWRQDKNILFLTSLLVLTMIQIPFDAVNKIWHTGSYAFFPYRYGFIPLFLLLTLAIYLLQKYEIPVLAVSKRKLLTSLLVPGILIIALAAVFYHDITLSASKIHLIANGLSGVLAFAALVLICVLFTFSYFTIFRHTDKLRRYRFLLLFAFAEILINSLFYIGIGDSAINREYQNLNQLKSYFVNTDTSDYRIKNLVFDSNASMVLDMNSNGYFTSLTNKNQMDEMKALGYSSYWMRYSDVGGTLFSDALMSQKYIFSDFPLDENFYTPIGRINNVLIYQAKYVLPVGYILNTADIPFNYTDIFANQNEIYETLSKDKEPLITVLPDFQLTNLKESTDASGMITLKKINPDDPAYLTMNLNADANSVYYLNILKSINNYDNASLFNAFQVYLNNEPFNTKVPSDQYVMYHKNKIGDNIFPQQLTNGLLDLGTLTASSTLKLILVPNEVSLTNLSVGAMNVSKFENVIKSLTPAAEVVHLSQNTVTADLSATLPNEVLFLSIPYETSWSLTVNGVTAPIEKVMGTYMGIPLKQGENKIQMVYTPKGLHKGILISLAALVLIISFTILSRFADITKSFKLNWLYKFFTVIFILAILGVYIIPIILDIADWIRLIIINI